MDCGKPAGWLNAFMPLKSTQVAEDPGPGPAPGASQHAHPELHRQIVWSFDAELCRNEVSW